MGDLARILLAACVLVGVGLALERALWLGGRHPSVGTRLVTAALAAVAFGQLLLVGWPLAVGAVAVGLLSRRLAGDSIAAPIERRPVVASLVAVVLGGLALTRPRLPLAWDEFVWLTKAQIESRGLGALRAAAVLPGPSDVFPAGYPLLWSALPGWLVRGGDVPALVWGFAIARLVPVAAFAWALATRVRVRTRALAAAAVVGFGAPLVLVHARLFYADLPIGLCAGALLLVLLPSSEDDQPSLRERAVLAALLAIVLAGLKDEGAGHAVALAGVALVLGGRTGRGPAAAAIVSAVVVALSWRLVLARSGITGVDHALAGLHLDAVGPLLRELVSSATDPWSWGIAWPLACAAVVASLSNRSTGVGRARLRVAAVALAAQLAVMLGALLVGPERVRAFALGGTLFNRLLVELIPSAVVVLALAADLYLAGRPDARDRADSPA